MRMTQDYGPALQGIAGQYDSTSSQSRTIAPVAAEPALSHALYEEQRICKPMFQSQTERSLSDARRTAKQARHRRSAMTEGRAGPLRFATTLAE